MTAEELRALEERLGFTFGDPDVVHRALTHRSTGVALEGHNEILEFLGDSVLGLAMTDLLVRAWPGVPEGILSKRRAALVSTVSLAERARELGLGPLMAIGRGEERTRGRDKSSILANAFEALLGAIHLDAGFSSAHGVVERLFAEHLREHPARENREYKTQLQELTQRVFREAPVYELVATTGPDHARMFESRVSVRGVVYGQGSGASKKIAEHHAAQQALDALRAADDADPSAGAGS